MLKLRLYGERNPLAMLKAPQGLAWVQARVAVGMICLPATRVSFPDVMVKTGFEPPGLPSSPFGALLPGRLSRNGLAFGVSKKSPIPPRSTLPEELAGFQLFGYRAPRWNRSL